MNAREFKTALKAGDTVYGMMLVNRSPSYAGVIAGLGMDFVFIDTEHVDIDRTTLAWMCVAYEALAVAPLVRITSPDAYEASTVIDAGAAGVIAPYVESPEQVRALVGAVKYKPIKGKRLEGFLKGEAPEPALEAYLREKSAGKSVIVNIESVPAMEALDEILAVPGLDGILIGPHDLSCSLGIPEEYENPVYDRAVREILSRARAAGVGAGIHVHYKAPPETETVWAREAGANFIVHRSDILSFKIAMGADLAALKMGIEGKAAQSETGNINL